MTPIGLSLSSSAESARRNASYCAVLKAAEVEDFRVDGNGSCVTLAHGRSNGGRNAKPQGEFESDWSKMSTQRGNGSAAAGHASAAATANTRTHRHNERTDAPSAPDGRAIVRRRIFSINGMS